MKNISIPYLSLNFGCLLSVLYIIVAFLNYHFSNLQIEFIEGETLTLLDNSKKEKWMVSIHSN